jgi:RimJ/RimL family protein N-acetyltransferase
MDTLIKLYKSYETERLLIRPTGIQDAPFIFQLMNSPKWLEFIGDRQIVSVDAAGSYIRKKMLPQLERLGFSNYTVIRKSDQAKLGSCGLYDREGLDGIDIGFAFLPEHVGQGYAHEAATRLMQAAREDFGLTRICGITDANNLSSQRLLEKLGLRRKGSIQLSEESAPVLLYLWDAQDNSP